MDLKAFLIEFLSCFSRMLNVICGGTADLTLSARAHIYGLTRTEAAIDWLFHKLTGERGHCQRWAEHEYSRSLDVVERMK